MTSSIHTGNNAPMSRTESANETAEVTLAKQAPVQALPFIENCIKDMKTEGSGEFMRLLKDSITLVTSLFEMAPSKGCGDGPGGYAKDAGDGLAHPQSNASTASPQSNQASASSVADDFARKTSEYNKQRNEIDAKNKAIDAHNAGLDPKIAAKEEEIKQSAVIRDNFDKMKFGWGQNQINEGMLKTITQFPGYSAEQKAAAQYFLDNPKKFEDFCRTYVQAGGFGYDSITGSDMGGQFERLDRELAELKSQRQTRLEYPPAPVLEQPLPPPPPPIAGGHSVAPPPPSAGTNPPKPPEGAKPPEGVKSPEGAKPPEGVKAPSELVLPFPTLSGSSLEQASQRIANQRARVEHEIDNLAAQMAALDPASATYKTDAEAIDRKMKKLASVDSVLTNMESMLQTLIDNIIKMRHELAMNAIRKIG